MFDGFDGHPRPALDRSWTESAGFLVRRRRGALPLSPQLKRLNRGDPMVRSVLTRFRAGPGVRAVAAAVLLVAAGIAPAAAMPADLVVQKVQAEAKAGPPTFSWQLASAVNGERQTAYRVRVNDVWDSGRVASGA